VTSPFNPDIITQARTLEEAFEMARDVVALFAEDRAAGPEMSSTRTSRAVKKPVDGDRREPQKVRETPPLERVSLAPPRGQSRYVDQIRRTK
ncbi:MAG TPA: hypothetical protein VGE74_15205, partial [Gemmata sp.]